MAAASGPQPTAAPPTAEQSAKAFVELLYRQIMRRQAGEHEIEAWARNLLAGMSEKELIQRFITSTEFVNRFKGLSPAHPPGHYYSPVVDPRELTGARAPNRKIDPADIAGITLDVKEMRRWWQANARSIRSTPFPDTEDGRWRYYAHNEIFPIGDAVVLRAMIIENRPARIVEIGSGFSTAVMLDTIDEHRLPTTITCIEPYAERLKSRLRPEDARITTIIEKPVQGVPLDLFAGLSVGDVLFIDSTHVLKTGSDVHYELFSILPALKPGVIVHFHDMHYPFEYPDRWIFDLQYSWNEVYAVRAFLMYNNRFRVTFMNGLFQLHGQDLLPETLPRFNQNPGASLWLKKVA
ncbi:MAG: class I SAM-dependent methyltransferase [Bauldia sp.]|nr:class I SAM-dependent methyltransferase [Bauldia sp.]